MNTSRCVACFGLLLPLLSSGCMSMTRLARELARDPASCTVRVTTIYGTLTFTRTNPGTNTPAHSIATDGTVTVR